MIEARLSILIPAAGPSTRLGQPKQLLQHKDHCLLQNTVNVASSVSPQEIIVVTGAHSYAVRDAVEHPSIHWVHNPAWFDGMGTSIAIGSAAISPASTGLMILLCDQWRIEDQDLKSLVKTWRADPQQIVAAQVDGQCMPPVIFPASYFSDLRKLQSHQGARGLLKAHQNMVKAVPMENAIFDVDTPAQLNAMQV